MFAYNAAFLLSFGTSFLVSSGDRKQPTERVEELKLRRKASQWQLIKASKECVHVNTKRRPTLSAQQALLVVGYHQVLADKTRRPQPAEHENPVRCLTLVRYTPPLYPRRHTLKKTVSLHKAVKRVTIVTQRSDISHASTGDFLLCDETIERDVFVRIITQSRARNTRSPLVVVAPSIEKHQRDSHVGLSIDLVLMIARKVVQDKKELGLMLSRKAVDQKKTPQTPPSRLNKDATPFIFTPASSDSRNSINSKYEEVPLGALKDAIAKKIAEMESIEKASTPLRVVHHNVNLIQDVQPGSFSLNRAAAVFTPRLPIKYSDENGAPATPTPTISRNKQKGRWYRPNRRQTGRKLVHAVPIRTPGDIFDDGFASTSLFLI